MDSFPFCSTTLQQVEDDTWEAAFPLLLQFYGVDI